MQITPQLVEARGRADRTVLEAERFKVAMAPPPGNVPEFENSLSDDNFFHLTCHIDKNLREKIERGEYVELEKLLPKDKGSEFGAHTGENRLEWIMQDGQTFLAPASNKSQKINGLKRWDQAFRVYATIFCGANPSRSKEIWQYVSVIHSAAAAFVWDNVANYDFTFRHLMEFNPQRSWAVTYTQMWNLSMREPLTKNNQFSWNKGSGHNFNSSGSQSSNGGSNNRNVRKKRKYCWGFNKGLKCKFGKNCRYIERCSFCDKADHGVEQL